MHGYSEADRELLDAASLCRQLVPQGSVEAFLADHRHALFSDAMFEDLFPSKRGRPSIPADVVAAVMVLQSLEGLSDRDAARALTDRISWKVACGLSLVDEGLDFTVLTYWRTRLRQSARLERVFEAVRSVITATSMLTCKNCRASPVRLATIWPGLARDDLARSGSGERLLRCSQSDVGRSRRAMCACTHWLPRSSAAAWGGPS